MHAVWATDRRVPFHTLLSRIRNARPSNEASPAMLQSVQQPSLKYGNADNFNVGQKGEQDLSEMHGISLPESRRSTRRGLLARRLKPDRTVCFSPEADTEIFHAA